MDSSHTNPRPSDQPNNSPANIPGTRPDGPRLRSLFDHAMELPPSERAAYLDSCCAGDAVLRSQLDQLVQAAESDPTFLSAPTGTVGDGTRERRISPVFERPGTKIGLYKLLQVIGEGGFGTVFLAEQDKPMRRRVALKILKLGMDTKSIIARFEAERQALALMDHPHIARVLDAGATESGRPFFVMEYVVGDAITRFADAHKLGVQDRLELFQQVCQAVQHAHTKGVIHRDLKPGNVLVSMSDGKPFAKVIDFGIAKATSQPLTDKTLFTEHRQLLGTPEYMSPEQAEGSADIDTRTDVYALGVLLYELLTGATPFDAKRLRSAAYAEMQRIIKEEEPPLPSVRLKRDLTTLAETAAARQIEPTKLNSLVKGELDWIVMKSLDKDRARRYETASALAADVQRHLAGEPVVAAPPSAGYRVRKFVRRNRAPVIAGGAVAAALLAGLAGTTWQWSEAKESNANLREQVRHTYRTLERTFAKLDQPWILPDSKDRATTSGDPDATWPLHLFGLSDGTSIAIRPKDKDLSKGFKYLIVPSDSTSQNEFLEKAYSNGPWKELSFTSDDELTAESLVEARRFVEAIGSALEESDGYNRAYYRDAIAQRDAAEWSAYTANIALAQASMQSNNWPEARQRLEACPESKRGWEWSWLSRRAHGVKFAIQGRFREVRVSDDGSTLLCSEERCLSEIDVSTGERTRTLDQPNGGFYAMRGVDGHTVALFEGLDRSDGRVVDGLWLWSTPDTTAKRIASAPIEGVRAAWLSPRAEILAYVPWGGRRTLHTVKLTVDGGQANDLGIDMPERFGHQDLDVAGRWLLCDKVGECIEPLTGSKESRVRSARGQELTWSNAGDWCASVDDRANRLTIINVASGSLTRVPALWGNVLNQVFTARSRCAVQASGSTVYIFDPQQPGRVSLWAPDRGYVYRGSLSADGSCFAAIAGEYDDYGNPTNLLLVCDTSESEASEDVAGSDHARLVLGTLEPTRSAEVHAVGSPRGNAIRPSVLAGLPTVVSAKGDRLVAAFKDSTIRFYETKDWREVAVIRVPQVVTDLKMTADGTRLILMHADGSARIWDIRDPAERLKDREREWAEQPEAEEYVDALLAGPRPTADLDAFLRADESLTPLRRLVAWRTLRDRLADLERESSDRYAAAAKLAEERQIKDKPAFVQLLEAELAAAKDLSPRVAEKVRAMGEKWEYAEAKASEAGKLSDAVRRADLLEAAGVMQRYLQPSEEVGYVVPSTAELRRAYELRLQHLGNDNDLTFEAEIETLINDADYLGEPDARVKLDEAIERKERRTPLPDAQLFRAWQYAADSNCDSCNVERAEHYFKKIADALRSAVDRKVTLLQIHEPTGDSTFHIHTGEQLSPGEVDRIERALRTLTGEALRRRCVNRTTRNLWYVMSPSPQPEWAMDDVAFDLAKHRSMVLSECRRVLALEPESILGHQVLALTLYRIGDFAAAREAIDRSIALGVRRLDDPKTPENESQPAPVARAIRALILAALGGDVNLAHAREEAAAASDAMKAVNFNESVLGFVKPAQLVEEAKRVLSSPTSHAP